MNENEAIALLIRSGCSPDVIEHCKAVAGYAKKIAESIIEKSRMGGHPISIDIDTLFIGALLHDIGRSKTHGMDHSIAGAEIAIEKGLDDKLVKIIERHIGAGITKEEAKSLGLAAKDYIPVSIEEKIVAHADNLVFGTNIGSMDELILHMRRKKMDNSVIRRFIELNNEITSMMV